MAITKKIREQVYNKFNGLCAYTGKPLDEKWQVDHGRSKLNCIYFKEVENMNSIDNYFPAISIINHYKREKTINSFREYMKTFHIRLSKLPKTTSLERTKRRIIYMNTIAELFNITVNKPFSGTFYFETLNN